MKLLDIKGSTVTTDAIGTQPQSYEEILKYFGEMSDDHKKMEKDGNYRPRYLEMQEKYEEASQKERNRDRQEYRWYGVCTECSLLTKTQQEWPFVKTVGLARQIRIPVERDAQGNDITPDIKTFLEKGSRRRPKPAQDEETGKNIQKTGMISDMKLTVEETGRIKREHWAVETVCIMCWTTPSVKTGHRQIDQNTIWR